VREQPPQRRALRRVKPLREGQPWRRRRLRVRGGRPLLPPRLGLMVLPGVLEEARQAPAARRAPVSAAVNARSNARAAAPASATGPAGAPHLAAVGSIAMRFSRG
jgi:hypothetical protein